MLRYFPKLNNNQLNRLSEILGNLGIVLFAGMVIPFIVNRTDPKALLSILFGLILSLFFWLASLSILKTQKGGA